MRSAPYGFRIVGSFRESRRLVNAAAALAGDAACDERAETHREAYLSAFQFGEDFRQRDDGWQVNVKGFDGPCRSPWLWFDIDREDNIDAAVRDTRRLTAALMYRYGIDGDELLVFYSGSKGFHVGLPTSLWQPAPSVKFNKLARRFAEQVAESLPVGIDTGVYDKVRPFRAPNSRHPKTGRRKRRLAFDELLHLKTAAIVEMAAEPEPFDLPPPPPTNEQATNDWQRASEHVARQAKAYRQRREAAGGTPSLNRRTLEFIREGAVKGDRHRLLFSAAANLAEFGCPPALALALLTEAALDAGLSPNDVRRQIECGLNASVDNSTQQDAGESTQSPDDGSKDRQAEKRDTGESERFERQTCRQMTGATK